MTATAATATSTQHSCEAFRFYFNEASCKANSTSRRSDRSAKRRLCASQPVAEASAPTRATKMLEKMSSFKRIRNLFNEHQIELATVYPKAVDHSIVPWQTNPMFKLKKLATHANIECLVDDLFGKLLDVESMPVAKRGGSKREGCGRIVTRG